MIALRKERQPSPDPRLLSEALKACADARDAFDALNSDDAGPSVAQAKAALAAAERALSAKQAEDSALRRVGRSLPAAEIIDLQRECDAAKVVLENSQRLIDGRKLAQEALRNKLDAAHDKLSAEVTAATATLRAEAEAKFDAAVQALCDSFAVLDRLDGTYRSHGVKIPSLFDRVQWSSTSPSPETAARLAPYNEAIRERDHTMRKLTRY